MREDKRVSSIARRINRVWVRKAISLMISADILVLLLLLMGYGSVWLKGEGLTLRTIQDLRVGWDKSVPGLWNRMTTVWVSLADAFGEPYEVTDPVFLAAVRNGFCILIPLEALRVLAGVLDGRKKARRLLIPLEQMAITTQQLTKASFDPERLHHLEDAIATVDSPDARLKTGDTELVGLEKAINDLLQRMNETYQEQTRFVSDASHELRTPIAVIQGYADLLDRWGKQDEKVLDESIAAIKSESGHMKKLIEQLLFLARGDKGKNQMNPAPMDLADMMKEVCEESRMIYPGREWKLKGETPVPVTGDRDLLKQTARILIENAVKYTGEGSRITLSAGMENGIPCFSVQDNGIGMKKEDLPHIFDRFFRSDPAREKGGTGLGLSIANWIVKKHGGYFEVLSREDFGTKMNVFLPQEKKN